VEVLAAGRFMMVPARIWGILLPQIDEICREISFFSVRNAPDCPQ
jgi:hypothetical protein